MQKVLIQLFTVLVLFFGTWFGLAQVNWRSVYKIDRVTKNLDGKLGDLLWDLIKKEQKVIGDKAVLKPVDSILSRICSANGFDRSSINMHVVVNDEINAFALPDNHLVINTGLIKACDEPEELAGVMGHEVAHIMKNHVMKKLVKEMGLAALIAITTGNKGGQVVQQCAKLLSSSAYDRTLEKEADIFSVDYMVKAGINPEALGNFMYKIADNESNESSYLSWINTHPETRERAQYIIEYCKDKIVNRQPLLPVDGWFAVKKALENVEGGAD